MTRRDVARPVEHLLPVSDIATGGSLHQQAGVPGLTVRVGRNEGQLGFLRVLEELFQHPVGGVEHVVGQIVQGVDEPGGQAAANTIDHGGSLLGTAILERKKIDFQNFAHAPTVASARSSGHRCDFVRIG